MRTLKIGEAAGLLNVSPSTLRAWEKRFGYPETARSVGGQRVYFLPQLLALQGALQAGLSVGSAISQVREGIGVDDKSLQGALGALDFSRCDAVMEATLAMRSLEDSVDAVLLPAVGVMQAELGTENVGWALVARWATEWLQRARRLTPWPTGRISLVLADASDGLGLEAVAVSAFELLCLRAGAEVLRLPVSSVSGLAPVVARAAPQVIVVVGSGSSDDAIARWSFPVRRALGVTPYAMFRRSNGPRAATSGALRVLSDSPLLASHEVVVLARQCAIDRRVPGYDRRPAARRASDRFATEHLADVRDVAVSS
jgi:DNA-binding transcriptional MerR regulator